MAGKRQPLIILVHPQMGENIGMCARAMLNCGLDRLRLVRPRGGWPQDSARATAADADLVLDRAEVFETLDEAIADCRRVIATTARDRSLSVPVRTVEEAAGEIAEEAESAESIAILFGPEASGLDRESVARADTLIRFPTNPEFPSLNLAQAVLLFGWEWRRASGGLGAGGSPSRGVRAPECDLPAEREELENFLNRLGRVLDEKGFFLTGDLKPHSLRTLRSLFTRMNATGPELNFLHGVLTSLVREEDSIQDETGEG